MFTINYSTPENAKGKVAKAYSVFPEQIGVPAPIQIFSASPQLLANKMHDLKYFMGHEELNHPLLAAIRFIAASHFNYDYCITFNAKLLKSIGLTDDEVSQLPSAPEAIFDESEAAILRFVSQSLDAPENIGENDIATLRNHGWTDVAIFDALAQAANIMSTGFILSTFTK